jgi:hypothetical protein
MLTGGFREGTAAEALNISFQDVSAHTFQKLLQYIYTDDISKVINPSNVMEILAIADRFQVCLSTRIGYRERHHVVFHSSHV